MSSIGTVSLISHWISLGIGSERVSAVFARHCCWFTMSSAINFCLYILFFAVKWLNLPMGNDLLMLHIVGLTTIFWSSWYLLTFWQKKTGTILPLSASAFILILAWLAAESIKKWIMRMMLLCCSRFWVISALWGWLHVINLSSFFFCFLEGRHVMIVHPSVRLRWI